MTAETSNARGEWVLVPREPTEAMIDAWRDAPDLWEDAYAAMLAAAQQPPAEAQAQGGGEVVAWRVPVLPSPFGEWLDHGVRDGLVLVMHRGKHGWKAAGQGHAMLAHQIYVKNVEPLCATSHEVAVFGLSGGGWRTVWARSDDDVTHPTPPSAPVGAAEDMVLDAIERRESSAPVGVDAPGSRAWMAEVCRAAALSLAAHGVRNDQLSKVADWIAQQPADVVVDDTRGRAK